MQEHKYITFDYKDIIEALEEYYEKRNDEKISISFDEENDRKIRQIRSITVRKSLSSPKSEILSGTNGPNIEIGYEETESKSTESEISVFSPSIYQR